MSTVADISVFESLGTTPVSVQNVEFTDLYGAKQRDKRRLLRKLLLGAAGAGLIGGGALMYHAGKTPDSIVNKIPGAAAASQAVHDVGNDVMSKTGGFLTDYSNTH